MTATHEDLRNSAAEELQVKRVGVDLSAEDAAIIDARIPRILAWLDESEGLVFWPDGEIPNGAVVPLTMIVAEIIAPSFTLAYDKGPAGLVLLRKIASPKPSKKPTTAVFF